MNGPPIGFGIVGTGRNANYHAKSIQALGESYGVGVAGALDTVLSGANRASVTVAAIFQARLSLGARALKQAIDAGGFGRLSLCSAYINWHSHGPCMNRRSVACPSGWRHRSLNQLQ
jgi:predicted dehydrogenase